MRKFPKPTEQEINEGPQAVSFQIADGNTRRNCTLQIKLPTKVQAQKYLTANWPIIEKMARDAATAGKMEDGQMLFRKGYKHLSDVYPDAERWIWYTYTGMDPQSFQKRNQDLLKQGYTLMQMQRFTDDEGQIYFCPIWVEFVPGSSKK